MQKVILVEKNYTNEINEWLKLGWKVVSVTPTIKCVSKYDTPFYGVYVVIEQERGDNDA